MVLPAQWGVSYAANVAELWRNWGIVAAIAAGEGVFDCVLLTSTLCFATFPVFDNMRQDGQYVLTSNCQSLKGCQCVPLCWSSKKKKIN